MKSTSRASPDARLGMDGTKRNGGMNMWEAIAEYSDGTKIRRLFYYRHGVSESEQQYDIECWLLGRHEGCTFYTVNYIQEETE